MIRICFGHDLGYALDMIWNGLDIICGCFGNVSGMNWVCFGYVLANDRHVPGLVWASSG